MNVNPRRDILVVAKKRNTYTRSDSEESEAAFGESDGVLDGKGVEGCFGDFVSGDGHEFVVGGAGDGAHFRGAEIGLAVFEKRLVKRTCLLLS